MHEPKGMRSDRRRDLMWGLRRGLLLSAFILVPATVAFGLEWLNGDKPDLPLLLKYLVSYLAFGGTIGFLAGLFRKQIATRFGATAFGAAIGCVSTAGVLLTLEREDLGFVPRADLPIGVMGTVAGALLGWWFWTISKHYTSK
jgi:O-antigen/teichoic acid export membrane protein